MEKKNCLQKCRLAGQTYVGLDLGQLVGRDIIEKKAGKASPFVISKSTVEEQTFLFFIRKNIGYFS